MYILIYITFEIIERSIKEYIPFKVCFTPSKDAECLRLSLLVLALIGIWLRTIFDVKGALRGTGNFEGVGTFDGNFDSRGALTIWLLSLSYRFNSYSSTSTHSKQI